MRKPVCEECRAEDPDTGIERGHDSHTGLEWKREYSQCCDSDVILVTKDDIEDEALKDHPDLIEFGYHPETLEAKADLVFKSDAQYNSLITHLKNHIHNWQVAVIHPDCDPVTAFHRLGSLLTRPVKDSVFYDWISNLLDETVDYSSTHFTIYRLLLEPAKKMVTIYWKLQEVKL